MRVLVIGCKFQKKNMRIYENQKINYEKGF
jgi:hypothetical protein